MPIFGNFRELPLPDVMALIERSTGKFEIWRFERQFHYEMQLQDREITAVRFNGQEIFDFAQAKSFIVNLVQANDGDFEFTRGGGSAGTHRLRIHEVLSSSLAAADEMNALREHFPESKTVFTVTGRSQVWLEPELNEFWQSAQGYFKAGASADELFEKMGLYLDQLLLKIYKLRASGLIEPQRAFGTGRFKSTQPLTVVIPPAELPAAAPKTEAVTEEVLQPIWSSPAAEPAAAPPPPEPAPVSAGLREEKGLRAVRPLQASKAFVAGLMQSVKRSVRAKS